MRLGGVGTCPNADGTVPDGSPMPIGDIGIVEMDVEFGVDKLPAIPRVYTGGDFLDRQRNLPFIGQTTSFFSPPWRFTGTGNRTNVVSQGELTNLVFYPESSPSFLGLFSDFRRYVVVAPHGSQVRSSGGDSGGPITFEGPDGPVIFAVDSLVNNNNVLLGYDLSDPLG